MKAFLKELFTDPYLVATICILVISAGYVAYYDYNAAILRREVVLQAMIKDFDFAYKELDIKLLANRSKTVVHLSSRKFELKDYVKIAAVYQSVLKKVGVKKVYYFKTSVENGKEVNLFGVVHDIQKDKFTVLTI
jgi:hypothetical protein